MRPYTLRLEDVADDPESLAEGIGELERRAGVPSRAMRSTGGCAGSGGTNSCGRPMRS